MTTEQIIEASLKNLRIAADAAFRVVEASPCDGPVLWAGLRCVEARWVVKDVGESYYVVLIEVAGPDAVTFQRLVRDELNKSGVNKALQWKYIRVVTEWWIMLAAAIHSKLVKSVKQGKILAEYVSAGKETEPHVTEQPPAPRSIRLGV